MSLYAGVNFSGSEKIAVVFDIGNAFTKCGFAGDLGPRVILPSEVKRQKNGQVTKIHSCTDAEDLYSTLVEFLHSLYFRHLLVNPKERRVVVVESMLTTTMFRETVAKVFFKYYEVPSVLFVPSHLLSLFTLGIPSAMVMDVGYKETLVLPVFESTPILKGWQAIPLAGQAVHNYLEAQLKETATVTTDDREEKPLSALYDTMDEKVLENIKVQCCFVTKMTRAQKIRDVKSGKAEASEAPDPPPAVEYPLNGDKILHIDGKIRESSCEILFEEDNEEKSVATLILDALLECPLDMRRTLAENVVVIGGGSMLNGFKPRLASEMKQLLLRPRYSQSLAIKEFKFHKPPAVANIVGWLGGAIFGALEVLGARSISRETYLQQGLVPDWCSLAEVEEKEEKISALKRESHPIKI